MRKLTVFFVLGLAVLSGCSQPLQTLMELNSEQAGQQAYVRGKQARFNALMRDIERDRLPLGLRKEKVLARYGQPVIIEEGNVFLYRDPVGFVGSPKVYIGFDKNDLVSSVKVANDNSKE